MFKSIKLLIWSLINQEKRNLIKDYLPSWNFSSSTPNCKMSVHRAKMVTHCHFPYSRIKNKYFVGKFSVRLDLVAESVRFLFKTKKSWKSRSCIIIVAQKIFIFIHLCCIHICNMFITYIRSYIFLYLSIYSCIQLSIYLLSF